LFDNGHFYGVGLSVAAGILIGGAEEIGIEDRGYATLILLRENGVPSVFYADLFGASYEDTGGDGQTYAIEMKTEGTPFSRNRISA
jgi:hypothetical protein